MPARGLLLALDYPPTGGGVSRLLEAWTVDSREVEWCVVTTTPGPTTDRVVRTTRQQFPRVALTTARSWLRSDQRVVVAGHPYLSGPAVLVAAFTGSRTACIAHGRELIPRRVVPRLALVPMLACHRVVAVSSHTAGALRGLGVRQNRIQVVRPMLGAPWRADAPASRARGAGLRLVAITRLSEGYKNVDLLLRICAVLHPRRVVDRLTIVGSGPRLQALRAKTTELGLDGVVALPGHLSDEAVREVVTNAHVGLFPSRHSLAERGFEGFGLVVHELAAGAMPVLVGSAAGARDAAVEPWGQLLDPDDLWAWVETLELFHADEELRLRLATAALAWSRSIDPLRSAREFSSAVLEHPQHEVVIGPT